MVGGRSSRGEGCKLCGAARDSVRHILACRSPTVRNEVLACRERAVALLRSAGVLVNKTEPSSTDPPPLGVADVSGGGDGGNSAVYWVPLWFDIGDTYSMCVEPGGITLDPGARDRLADLIGVAPTNLYGQLGSKWNGSTWEVRPPEEVRELVGRVRLELVYGSLRAWLARCRAMAKWWESPAACNHRAQWIRERATRERARREKRDKALLTKWVAARGSRARKRKHKHVRPEPGETVATRLSRKRVQTDRGCYGLWSTKKTMEEYEEDLARQCLPGERIGQLPWF